MSSGAMCPICGVYSCKHRSNCNFCGQYSQWVDRYGITVMHPNTGKPMIHDLYGYPHKCREGKKGPVYVNSDMQHDLAQYLQNMLRLGNDGYWHGWRDDKYVGRVEKATPEAYKSWSP